AQDREPVLAPRGQDRGGAGGAQGAGELLTEAGARTGHDDHATVQGMAGGSDIGGAHLKSVQFSITDLAPQAGLRAMVAAADNVHPTSTEERDALPQPRQSQTATASRSPAPSS